MIHAKREQTRRNRPSLSRLLGLASIGIFALVACTPGGAREEVSLPYAVEQSDSTLDGSQDGESAFVQRSLQMVTILPPDRIPAIRNPEFVSAIEAERWMVPDEPVIGVEINGEARAYSTFMLSRHEIVNDIVGGRPIAVTW